MDTFTPTESTESTESSGADPVDARADPPKRRRTLRSVWRTGAIIVAALAAAFVVVDGSPTWILVRLAIVGITAFGLVRAVGRASPIIASAGAVIVAIGAGFLPHLFDNGLSPRGLASLALIGSGLTLLVGGTVDLVHDRRWWWRVIGAVVALVALAVAMSIVTPAVLATNVPRPALGDDPEQRGLAAESLTFTTQDGVEIAAWYVPSRNGASVVLRHGAGSTRSNVLDEADVLARHGYGVLMTDAQGHGVSDGRAMDFGWNGDVEIAAAIDYLESRADVDRIGLVGSSMGGEEVLGAMAAQPLVVAVVAEGATARRAADKAWLSEAYGIRGALQEQLDWVQDGLTNLLTDAGPPTVLSDAVRRSDAAVLLITAGKVPDEGHAAARIASAAPERVEIWTVDGAGHTAGLATDPVGWERHVIEFLDANL